MKAAFNLNLTSSEHLSIGIYLISSGFVSGFVNIVGIVIFARFHKLLWNPTAIPELALLMGDLTVAGLHPFSGTAALVNRWVWGPVGCQLYPFSGFLFGNFQMLVIPLIAFDRYVTSCETEWVKYRSFRTYSYWVIILFAMSFFWSITPVIGWASYNLIPTQIYCSLDWTRSDASYVSYLVALTFGVTVGPMAIAAVFYWLIYNTFRKVDRHYEIDWAPKKWTGTVIMGRLMTTYVAYFGFCITCVWPLLADPRKMTYAVHALAPLMAKTGGIINPIFYTMGNPIHWACVKKMFGMSDRAFNEIVESRGKELIQQKDSKLEFQDIPLETDQAPGEGTGRVIA